MYKEYSVETHDDVIPEVLRKEVWDYIQNQSYYAIRKDILPKDPNRIIWYKPIDGLKEYMNDFIPSVNNQMLHRCVLGENEQDLELHQPIKKLWTAINRHFGNCYEINGSEEGVNDPNRRQKARIYVNAQAEETIKRSHGIHRDTIDVDEDRNFTLLYIANLEWYPTWMGEFVTYADDNTTGDTQQFQKGITQSRGFNVGYPFKMIPPIPGRIVVYDGRTLHTTKPTSVWAQAMRYAVVFRIRLK
jgi:hypothetical protein